MRLATTEAHRAPGGIERHFYVTQANTLPDRWETLDLPVLNRVARIIEVDRADEARPEQVANDLGISKDDALRSMLALHAAGYIEGIRADSLDGKYVTATDLTERGRRAVRIWPSEDVYEALLAGLEEAAERTDDPSEAGALRRAGRYLKEAPRDLVVDVVGAVIAKTITG